MARDRNARRGRAEKTGAAGNQAQGYYQQDPNGQPRYYRQDPSGQPGYYQQNPEGQQGYYQQEINGQQGYYQTAPNRQPAAGVPDDKKKKKRRKRKIILFIVEVILLLALAAGLYIAAQVSKLSRIQVTIDKTEESEMIHQIKAQLSSEAEEKLKGYWNIALYGVDSRYGLTSGQSDTIIICSINRDTNDIKLASVYRDSYLDDSEGQLRKLTDIYGMYGPARSISTLNKNFDLDITNYVTVNMNVVADVVDSIGGVEIDVKSMDEATWINNYQNETSEITGRTIVPVTEPGLQTLNGLQATSYCRIRAIGNDYERTERQRTVLMKIMEKFQSNPTLLLSVIDDVLKNVETNLTNGQIMDLAKSINSYRIADTVGFPFEKQGMSIANDIVAPINLAQNVKELHQYLFGTEDYMPSAVVQEISNTIANVTGLY